MLRGPDNRRAGLAAQEAFKAWAEGWETHHTGWPDYLCVHDGQIVAVEVKSGGADMSAEQREVAAILASIGVKVYVWSPESHLVEVRQRRTDLTGNRVTPRRARRQPKAPGMVRLEDARVSGWGRIARLPTGRHRLP